MKTTKLMWRSLCTAFVAASAFVSCQEDIYTIDSPEDLQEKIDAIAAEREAAKAEQGDNEELIIGTYEVGTPDCSAGWWSAFSDYFKVPTGKMLVLEFVNHGSGANNWNNWNLGVTTPDVRDGSNYSEYFVLRSDAYGWGNDKYDGGLIKIDYPDLDGDGDIWNDFRNIMQGANVVIKVDHSKAGYCYVTATATSADGQTTITETYNHPVSTAEDIQAFLIADGSFMEMKKATLMPSEVAELVDYEPMSLTVTGTPKDLVIGESDFWGAATAVVSFADGSSVQVDTADINFIIIPDLTTVGSKTIVLTYANTKLGNSTKPVSAYYSLEVTNKVTQIKLANPLTYFLYKYTAETLPIYGYANGYSAIYADGSESALVSSNVGVEETSVPAALGEHEISMTYLKDETIVAKGNVKVVESKDAQTNIGAADFTNGWWTTFSDHDVQIAPNTAYATSFVCKSDNLGNWHSPCYILRGAALNEYVVTRSDHYGWGNGYDASIKESNWNWDTFMGSINDSKYDVVVVNNGDNTADILVSVTYADGEKHFQNYRQIAVDSSDLFFSFVTEESYLVWE